LAAIDLARGSDLMLPWISILVGAICVGIATYLICAFLWRSDIASFVTWNQRRAGTLLLTRAGYPNWNVGQLYLIKFTACGGATVVSVCLLNYAQQWDSWSVFNLILVLVCAVLGYGYPSTFLRSQARKRQASILRDMPPFLDLIVLGLESGLNLQASLQLALLYSRTGPLHSEWARVLHDIRSGQPRVHALTRLAVRTDMTAVRQLVSAICQAESTGFSVGSIIRGFSDQHRAERLMKIEKLAMQAPVKMLFPMALCIFPCTFLVLGMPVAAQLLNL
jgi:tight adherence protein C